MNRASARQSAEDCGAYSTMNHCLAYFVSITVALFLSGCAGHQQFTAKSLIGRWESEEGPTEWGRAKFELVFSADGILKVSGVFTEQSPASVLINKGVYRVVNHTLVTNPDLMNKGKPVPFWFDHGDLIIKVDDEAPGRFHPVP